MIVEFLIEINLKDLISNFTTLPPKNLRFYKKPHYESLFLWNTHHYFPPIRCL